MLGRRHAEASPTASGYSLLINAESAEGNPAFTKENWSPRIGRICTDLWERLSFEENYNPRKGTKLSRKRAPRIGRICTELLERLSFEENYNPLKSTKLSRKRAPRIGRICTDLWERLSFGDGYNPRKGTKNARRRTPRIGRISRYFILTTMHEKTFVRF